MDIFAKNKPLISIIIPCYNDAKYIEESVQSALNQTYSNKEVIVVDDGSNLKTKKVLDNLENKVQKLITQKNKGVSVARNVGIEACSGEYVLVLDSDDYFEPSFCEKALQIFEKESDVKIVTCYSKWFNARTHITYKPKGGNIKDILISNVAMGSSMLRKQDWQIVEGYDEKMTRGYEDWEFYMRLLKSGGKAEVIPEILFNYRNKENSRNKKANLAKYDILGYIYKKHAVVFKDHFDLFISEWLESIRKSEAFKQQVMDSLDYKLGNKLLKPFRFFGLLKKANSKK
ncbi:glycosyltransferase family 2 protein [Gillisia hiemivivida]|uniref:Glycosyltransferase family 2 protein n=1 Tax=Gillisia hiemivivida TaxID=291190 RepID=A0A5C6ZTK3_9FLAO|nr:glycosyltransferase family A protein [Gillisia hiemivivida]TXD93888.1 glycosyltransferase family 2 protein [Gillisia hiemivivida]